MRLSPGRLILFLLALWGFSTQVSANDLWTRAVEYYEEYGSLVPGYLEIRFDQYNGRGKLLSEEYSEIEISVGADGEITSRTIFASRDGEDVTDERQVSGGAPPFGGSDSDDVDRDTPFAGLMLSPFDPDEQEHVMITDTGRLEAVEGVPARVFLYRHATSERHATQGTVWIEPGSGAPVRLSAAIDPKPGYLDEFEMVQVFETDAEGRWYLSRMSFVGEGNILFVKRRVESEFAFRDYFSPPPTELN